MSADFRDRDPTADELVQRFRITSTSSLNSTAPKRPSLTIVKRGSSIRNDAQIATAYSLNRNCVSSLHQNGRTSLLYGKNNVTVATDGNELKGYLSLHQSVNGLTLKWLANQIMNSQPNSGPGSPTRQESTDSGHLWKHTIIINILSIIYIHLHQQDDESPVSLVFVDAEGVQHKPFQFPPGQHCVAFLACLETGLNPSHKLDPPLQNEPGIGKILPQLKARRRSSLLRRRSSASTDDSSLNSPEKHDYVFRIRKLNNTFGVQPLSALNGFVQKNDTFQSNSLPNSPALIKKLNEKMGNARSKAVQRVAKANTTDATTSSNASTDNHTEPIDQITNACQLMRQQILSRAFYGWLIYCKHMKTIRTHLVCTIDSQRLEDDEHFEAVDELLWQKCRELKTDEIYREFLIRCYFKGIKHALRPKIWPFLLQLIPWDKEIEDYMPEWRAKYKQEVAEWKVFESEVVKRDSEQFQIARMRQSSNVEDYKCPPIRGNSTCSEVFAAEPNSPTANCVEEKNEQNQLIEEFGTNLHRIEKDVERCDRHTEFFSNRENLESLKRIMCTYVFRNLEDGYVQGMCDIAAPLLVIFQDEVLTLECFEIMMKRMQVNFPHGNGIETNLNNLRSIVSVMDPDLHCQLMSEADYTHLYFAYRWFLLDFKREFVYDDVFLVWEVIWSSSQLVSKKFQLFIAFALLVQYREILIENHMDFTDVIKFFNEMAEKHNVTELLKIAREKLSALQDLTKSLNLMRMDDEVENQHICH
ncbi:Small G protein signaling modulator 1 [Aphelenchoides bicaudatus]|nr:Small G protein signaling modulator 1 [Aphelenchoides bicaudatus]